MRIANKTKVNALNVDQQTLRQRDMRGKTNTDSRKLTGKSVTTAQNNFKQSNMDALDEKMDVLKYLKKHHPHVRAILLDEDGSISQEVNLADILRSYAKHYHQEKMKRNEQQKKQHRCELFDFGRSTKVCENQCASCKWMDEKKENTCTNN